MPLSAIYGGRRRRRRGTRLLRSLQLEDEPRMWGPVVPSPLPVDRSSTCGLILIRLRPHSDRTTWWVQGQHPAVIVPHVADGGPREVRHSRTQSDVMGSPVRRGPGNESARLPPSSSGLTSESSATVRPDGMEPPTSPYLTLPHSTSPYLTLPYPTSPYLTLPSSWIPPPQSSQTDPTLPGAGGLIRPPQCSTLINHPARGAARPHLHNKRPHRRVIVWLGAVESRGNKKSWMHF